MARQLSPDKRRVSYAEWKDHYDWILDAAKARRLTPTDIIREAVSCYIESAENERKERLSRLRTKTPR